MITNADLVAIRLFGSPTQGAPITRERGERWINRMRGNAAKWELVTVLTCDCCGEPAWENGRCTKHQGRNPCAIEGCGRTTAAPESGVLSRDGWLCPEHWRRYVPPRSMTRRAYHGFFRQAKRHGWGYKGPDRSKARLDWRLDQFWIVLVRRARRRATEGHIDEAAILRLMGWDEAEG